MNRDIVTPADVGDDTGKRPRPILKAAGVVGGLLALIGGAVQTGLADGLVTADVASPVAAVVGFLLPLGAALGVWTVSEGKVTPVADPTNETGQRLVEAHGVEDVAKAAAPAVADALASRYPGLLSDAVSRVYGDTATTTGTPATGTPVPGSQGNAAGFSTSPGYPAAGDSSTTPVFDALADQYGRHAR